MAEYCTCDVEACEMHTLKGVTVSSSDLATLRAEVAELWKDRERLNSLVRRTQPLVRSLAHSSRYPNSAVVSLLNEIDAAIEAAKGGE